MSKVLVVDDEEDIGIMMKAMLKSSGYSVVYANSFSEAQSKLQDHQFETIFLDLNLDNEYGLNLVPAIRETNKEANIIVITAQKGLDIKKELSSSGIDFLIQKPFNKKQILTVLEKEGE